MNQTTSTASGGYRICNRCIMDTSDPRIQFDEHGNCNHCNRYFTRAKNELFHGEEGKARLDALVSTMKEAGKGRPYDCVIGVSGGVDSTMVAYLCKQLGLRPLAVHFDNGWNTELAVSNIEKTLNKLGVDLYTHVMDWEEFRDLQLSFLKASVANAEIPTDHAITASLLWAAAKNNVPFIISGSNLETEAIMPAAWVYDNRDYRHLSSIHRRFGKGKLKTFPHFTLASCFYLFFVKKLRFVKLLNYMRYNKDEAKALLQSELGWVDYGGKHYESLFTRFFQGYYLPKKFGIDKRRAHLSTLVCSGQISRENALEEMKNDPYPAEMFREDRIYVMKKFGLSEEQFESIMTAPVKEHSEYPSNSFIFARNRFGLLQWARRIALQS